MILFDPGLTPHTPPAPLAAQRSSLARLRPASRTPASRNLQLPSARTLARFLAAAQAAVRLRGQVSVLLTTDLEVRRLNRRFRGINRATDVLSFPAAAAPPSAEQLAGDLAISVPTARRQAAGHGHSLSVEIKVLMLHGLLHLAGYDHEADDGQMARKEKLLRARLGLSHGLIERAAGTHANTPKSRQPGSARAAGKRAGRQPS
jgi:probable rRNA maturation factor